MSATNLLKEVYKKITKGLKFAFAPIFIRLMVKNGAFIKTWNELDVFENKNEIQKEQIQFARLKETLLYAYELPHGIEPVLTWKSAVSMVKTVHMGESIGCGRTYEVRKEMRVATIPTDYTDGYNRGLSNKGYVLINGKKAPIVGKICMDQFMVDVSAMPGIQSGDEMILLGHNGSNGIIADDMAQQLGTIGYEVICNIGKRVPRIYL